MKWSKSWILGLKINKSYLKDFWTSSLLCSLTVTILTFPSLGSCISIFQSTWDVSGRWWAKPWVRSQQTSQLLYLRSSESSFTNCPWKPLILSLPVLHRCQMPQWASGGPHLLSLGFGLQSPYQLWQVSGIKRPSLVGHCGSLVFIPHTALQVHPVWSSQASYTQVRTQPWPIPCPARVPCFLGCLPFLEKLLSFPPNQNLLLRHHLPIKN